KAIFIGTDKGVYFSCNDGQHWERVGSAVLPNTHWNDVRYDPYFKRVVASSMGRGVWEIDEPSMDSCPLIDGGGTGGAGGTGGVGGAGGAGGATGGAAGAGTGGSGPDGCTTG